MLDGEQLIKDLYFPNSESRSRAAKQLPEVPKESSWNRYFLGGLPYFFFFFLGDSLWFRPELGITGMLLATFTRWLSSWMALSQMLGLALSSLLSALFANCHIHRKRRKSISTHVRRWEICSGHYRVFPATCEALFQVRFVIIWPLMHTHRLTGPPKSLAGLEGASSSHTHY